VTVLVPEEPAVTVTDEEPSVGDPKSKIGVDEIVKMKVPVFVLPPPVPVTVTVDVPVGVDVDVVIVSVLENVGLPELGVNEHVAPVGSPEQVREID
jgi:hypothetical protein